MKCYFSRFSSLRPLSCFLFFFFLLLSPLFIGASPVSAAQATNSRGVYTKGSGRLHTADFSVESSFISGDPFVLGQEYVVPVSVPNSPGKLNVSGFVQIPVLALTTGKADFYNRVTSSDIHLGISRNFWVYDMQNVSISNFKNSCAYKPPLGSTSNYQNYCVYSFNFSGTYSNFVAGNYNFNFSIYDSSNNNDLILQSTSGVRFFTNFSGVYTDTPVAFANLTFYSSGTSTGGASTGNQETIINQNQTIINQNDTHTQQLNWINDALHENRDAITDAKNQAHEDSQAQVDAINNQSKQDKEQYDKDKQEETDRENSGKDDANTAQGIFNFNILNPFAPLFALFSPNQCVNIPTISGMVGSEDAKYCSWFSQSTRSILTPAFGIVSIMLLFGFVVRWLSGSNVTLFKGGF